MAEKTKKITFVNEYGDGEKVSLVMREPNREEAVTFLELRERAENGKNTNITNDGDEQIFSCIISHSSEEVRAIFGNYPSLSSIFRGKMAEYMAESVVSGSKGERLSKELEEKYGKKNFVFNIEDKELIFSRLERAEVKFLEKEAFQQGYRPMRTICAWGDAHVLADFKKDYELLCAEKPFLPYLMGLALLSKTSPVIEEEEKK